jgi:hypothetical protein
MFLGFDSVIFPPDSEMSNRKILVPFWAKSKLDTNSRASNFFIGVVLFVSENTEN